MHHRIGAVYPLALAELGTSGVANGSVKLVICNLQAAKDIQLAGRRALETRRVFDMDGFHGRALIESPRVSHHTVRTVNSALRGGLFDIVYVR